MPVDPAPLSPAGPCEAVGEAIVAAAGAAGVGVVMASFRVPQPELLYVSETAAEILGHDPQVLLGRPAWSLIPTPEHGRLRDLLTVATRQKPGEWRMAFETALRHPGGQTTTLQVTASESELEGQPVVVAFVADVSRERAARAKLLWAEEQFRRLIDAAPEAIWINTPSAVLYGNVAALRLFGYERLDQVAHKNPLSFIHPDDLPLLQRRIRALFELHESVPPAEYRIIRADGSRMLCEVTSILGEYAGRPAAYAFARDVTERRQFEAQLFRADRLGVLGLLAGGMAHAINNPLTYVLLNIDHLLQTLPEVHQNPALLGEALARLHEAHDGSERVAAVVRRMRAFSRSGERDAAPVEVREVLESAVAMVGNEIRHRGRLVTDYQPVPTVYASLARLEQVFLNLLVCAAQSLPEDGPEGEVRVTLRPGAPTRVVVEVSDNGPGLDPQVVQRIYDPLSNRDSLADRTALGLSLCHSIVSSIGGGIQIESHPGRGTVFRVDLPADTQAAQLPPQRGRLESEPPVWPLPRARVMVVDDDQGVADALRLMLEDEHDVTSVASGREALRLLLQDDGYDVVFCDLMMPELSGMDLYEALRLNVPGRERRLVFMTGGAFTFEAVRFLSLVPNPRIEKPFDLRSVRHLLWRAAHRPM